MNRLPGIVAVLLLIPVLAAPAVASDTTTELIHHGDCAGAVSSSGQFIAFGSTRTDVVPGDTDGQADVFVLDRGTGEIVMVSVSTGGEQGNNTDGATGLDMSDDGRYVVYASFSDNLVPGDTNVKPDIFLRDRVEETTTLVSRAWDGGPADGFSTMCRISADGRYVVYQSFATNLVNRGMGNNEPTESDVFLYDVETGVNELVSVNDYNQQGNRGSASVTVSDDGRWVAFESQATNLDVTRSPTGWHGLVFIRDRQEKTTRLVSMNNGGEEANDASSFPRISGNGRYVVFSSHADNLVAGDTNECADIFVRDVRQEVTELVSVGIGGEPADDPSFPTDIDKEGRFVAFRSLARNLVEGDPLDPYQGVYVRDRKDGYTEMIDVNSAGEPGNGQSVGGLLTPSGRFVFFSSQSTNLYEGDEPYTDDVFLRDRGPQSLDPDDGCDDIGDLSRDVRRELRWRNRYPRKLALKLRTRLNKACDACYAGDAEATDLFLGRFDGLVEARRGGRIPCFQADRWLDRSSRVFD